MASTVLQPGRYTAVCYVDIPDVDEHIAVGNTEERMRASVLANFSARDGGFARDARLYTNGAEAWLLTRHLAADDTLNFNLTFTLDTAQSVDYLGTQVLRSINWYAQTPAERSAPDAQQRTWFYTARSDNQTWSLGYNGRFANGVRPARAHTTWSSYLWYVLSWLDGSYVCVDVRPGETPRPTNSSDSAIGRATDYVNPAPELQSSTDPNRNGRTPLENMSTWSVLDTVKALAIGGLVVGGIIGIAVIATNVRRAVS